MSLYDQATQSKQCPGCEQVFTGQAVHDNFFKLQSTKDGFARKCKKCYYVKVERPTAQGLTAAAARPTKVKGSTEATASTPSVRKAYTHTDAEIKREEARTGLKFKSWYDAGDCYMPIFGGTK